VVLLGRTVAWFGRGIRGPARDALLAAAVAPADRGKAFGFHRAGDTLGAIVGPLLGTLLLAVLRIPDPGDTFRLIFLLTLVPGLGSALAFTVLVRERRLAAAPARKLWVSVGALPGPFRRFLLAVGVFGFGDFAPTLLILAATRLLEPAHGFAGAALIGTLLYALRNALEAAAAYPIGALSDRLGRRGLLVLGFALGGVVMAGFAVVFAGGVASVPLLAVLFGLAGVVIAFQEALAGALAADLVRDETLRGTAFGALGAVNGVGDLVSSVVVGLLMGVSPVFGFGYAALMMLAGALLLYRAR
jgi:MFS family permease